MANNRTQILFEQLISLFEDPTLITAYTGPVPYHQNGSPEFDVDVPLLIDLLGQHYGVAFHDHGDGSIHTHNPTTPYEPPHEDQGIGNN